METKLQLFNEKQIRTSWNANEEEWYFSVVDVVAVLTDSENATDYFKKMRKRDTELADYVGTNCPYVAMTGANGKTRNVLAATTKGVLRIIQSIPSPKAEPFKIWLAQVGAERLDEIADPEKAFKRGADFYRQKGYSDEWINQRMQTIQVRKKLTDEWRSRGIESNLEYAILTNDMTKAWSGKTVREYKELKGLKKENLRDNMTDIELALNMLAEATTTAISKREKPVSFDESRQIARDGGKVAKDARKSVEKRLGEIVISPLNANAVELLTTSKDENGKKGDNG